MQMKIHNWGVIALLVASFLTPAGSRAQQAGREQQGEKGDQGGTIRIGSEEVLLDLVVRDKRGRPVSDLRADEVEVYEDGIRQQLSSFRLIDRNRPVVASEIPATGGGTQAVRAGGPGGGADPLRQINLVTMIFERLNNESRILARDAANEFLKNELRPNTMVAVFVLDQQLRVLQQFSNDVDRLKTAVERASGTASPQFAEQSLAIERELQNYLNSQTATDAASANAQATGGVGIGQMAVATRLAEITINTLRLTDDLQRQQQGSSSLYSLLSLVREQRRLSGRKTILYFSEGLQVTPVLTEVLKNTISAANKSNVSFYAVDARGLQTSRQTDAAREALNAAVSATQQQQRNRGSQPVTPEQAKAFDTAEGSILKDTQFNLATLAESTGGFLIANTNDIRTPIRRVGAELATYYEVSYTPVSREYDGRFREIKVKLLRPDTLAQTRSGYFALPPGESGVPGLLGFEMPMLAALGNVKLPREFEYRTAPMHFESDERGTHYALICEVPVANLTFIPDKAKNTYRSHIALMALIKGADGAVVQKFSQDYPFEGPLEKLEGLKRGNVVFIRNFRLPAGRYTLETAVHDRDGGHLSARRAILMVGQQAANTKRDLSMSSVTVIKRVDPVDPGVRDADNPFRFADGRIIPNLGDPILPTPGTSLSFYFVVYPGNMTSEKPQLALEFLLDGEVMAQATPTLGQADERGRIPFIAPVPIETFKTGRYEIRVIIRQGKSAVEEHAFFTIGGQS